MKSSLLGWYAQNKKAIAADTIESISKLRTSCHDKNEQISIYPIVNIVNAKLMFDYGFWPTHIVEDTHALKMWYEGVNNREINFWTGVENMSQSLKDTTHWTYKPLKIIVQEAIQQAKSLCLKMWAPQLLYKSMRPITDMSLFRSSTSPVICRKAINNNKIELYGQIWNVIPVTRYAVGMSGSLFYGSSQEQFLGTFYYYEPESTTLLAYQSAQIEFNKMTAIKHLSNKSTKIQKFQNFIERQPDTSRKLQQHANGIIPKDLNLSPMEALILKKGKTATKLEKQEAKSLAQDRQYAGDYLNLYACEDRFDQDLCILAQKSQIDVIILRAMIGSFQTVCEILDTRSRKESFANLVYIA